MSQAGPATSSGGGGGGALNTLSGDTGGLVPPSAGNIAIVAHGASSSGISTNSSNLVVSGNSGASTLVINETQAQFITNYVFTTGPTYTATTQDYYISVDSTGGPVSVQLPNSPTQYRTFVVKDSGGVGATNVVTVTTIGGVVLIDGQTAYLIDVDYESSNFIFNGTEYEAF